VETCSPPAHNGFPIKEQTASLKKSNKQMGETGNRFAAIEISTHKPLSEE
jgi:hypothetical protein